MNAGAVEQHFEIASRFYAPTDETYIGMARLYAEDAAMRKFHNGHHPRMVEFPGLAMRVFAGGRLHSGCALTTATWVVA